MSGSGVDAALSVEPDDRELAGDGRDATRVVLRLIDENGNSRPMSSGAVQLKIAGPGQIVGTNPFALSGGAGAIWVKAREGAGVIRLDAEMQGLKPQSSRSRCIRPNANWCKRKQPENSERPFVGNVQLNLMPDSFGRTGILRDGGETPWSARHALVPLFCRRRDSHHKQKAGQGAGCGPGGPPHLVASHRESKTRRHYASEGLAKLANKRRMTRKQCKMGKKRSLRKTTGFCKS